MRFVFKIYSGYDGFRPARIPGRQDPHGRVRLSWVRYIESVNVDDEVWVYFHGPHAFTEGVYIKGVVDEVDVPGRFVWLRPQAIQLQTPLTSARVNRELAHIVQQRYRQVFLLPDTLVETPACSIVGDAASCAAHHCSECATWKALPLIPLRKLATPHRIPDRILGFVPAYWVIATRSAAWYAGPQVKPAIRKASEVFTSFKVGNANLAYPLALGIAEQLDRKGLGGFDAIVPVPLSPRKAANKEIHRTRLLATELASLIGSPRRDWLSLGKPITKRMLRTVNGLTAREFERRYKAALGIDIVASRAKRVLIVDDVCTEGSTLLCCAEALQAQNPRMEIALATAGQMTVKAAVRDPESLLRQPRTVA